ncbi:hypothetical protein Pen02_62270 [Plantactinospora endophytica]|uniref:Uncharacterized protein n=1 Tax=Plantactinospora endophytica TaxID=673535 RepID=A0ABQ4EAK1_9ACTN|nr:hypothetical protein Pen02_62270 [Plantactinospora endophytica]
MSGSFRSDGRAGAGRSRATGDPAVGGPVVGDRAMAGAGPAVSARGGADRTDLHRGVGAVTGASPQDDGGGIRR